MALTNATPREGRRATQAALLMSARIVSMGLVFLAGIVTARIFDRDLRGEYAMLATAAAFTSTFANMGFAESVVYFVRRDDASLKQIHTGIASFDLAMVAVVALVGLVLAPWMASNYFPEGGVLVAWVAIASGLLGIFQRNALALAQALGRFAFTAGFWVLQPSLFMGALVLAAATGADLRWVSVGFAASWLLPGIFLFVHSLVRWRPSGLDGGLTLRIARFSAKSQANVAVNQLNYRLDMFVVAAVLADLAPVADYHIAASLAGLIWLFPDTYGVVVYPRLSAFRDERERTREAVHALRLVFVTAVTAAVVLAPTAAWFIPLVFGTEYTGAVALVWILLPGVVLISLSKIVSRYLLSRNRHQISAYWSLGGVAVNVAAILILTPWLGIRGTALAATLAYTVTTVGMLASTVPMADLRASDWSRFPAREIEIGRRALKGALRRLRPRRGAPGAAP